MDAAGTSSAGRYRALNAPAGLRAMGCTIDSPSRMSGRGRRSGIKQVSSHHQATRRSSPRLAGPRSSALGRRARYRVRRGSFPAPPSIRVETRKRRLFRLAGIVRFRGRPILNVGQGFAGRRRHDPLRASFASARFAFRFPVKTRIQRAHVSHRPRHQGTGAPHERQRQGLRGRPTGGTLPPAARRARRSAATRRAPGL